MRALARMVALNPLRTAIGGDDGKGCPDLLLDIRNAADINRCEKAVDAQLAVVQSELPTLPHPPGREAFNREIPCPRPSQRPLKPISAKPLNV